MKLRVNYFSQGLLLVAFMLWGTWAMAQRTISGTVTDAATKEPLIGANVLVVGTSAGTITDIDGTYSVNVPAGATELEFSYTGYASQKVAISDPSDPFDDDSGHWLAVCLRGFVEQVHDPLVEAKAWRAFVTSANRTVALTVQRGYN